jgi:hypothetical protein
MYYTCIGVRDNSIRVTLSAYFLADFAIGVYALKSLRLRYRCGHKLFPDHTHQLYTLLVVSLGMVTTQY